MAPFVNLGHDTVDIFTSLALDDALIARSKKTRESYIRTYEFTKPSMSVSVREDLSDLKNLNGIDYTRRRTGGSVISLGKEIFGYSIVEPRETFNPDVVKAHHWFGHKIGLALKDLGLPEVYVGEHFSISLKKSPYGIISGNSGLNQNDVFFYHGVLVVSPLNVEMITHYVKLRRTGEQDEFEMIKQLPNIEDTLATTVSRTKLSQFLVDHISSGSYREATEEEKHEVSAHSRKIADSVYKNPDWISGKDMKLKSNLGFCLVTILPWDREWKEDRFYSVEELREKFKHTSKI